MIPSNINKLLVAEDWTKIYQSFKNAEFKSYDFETLRRTMITYLRENYPEDFNDYIDSSEYIAIIDLIAYLGQNLSFRVDLNARENFLETAERRDSVLRLARLINYNAKRNVPGHGFLKITSISTTESVFDSNGSNLANQIIGWNDPSNTNWYQQFIAVINSAMSYPTSFGKPYAAATIGGIATEQYKLNVSTEDVPVYSFNKNIGGTQMTFELVPATFEGQTYISEDTPRPKNQFGIIFKNDNKGSGSSNTGFFVHFRQGSLSAQGFSVTNPVPNELIGVNVPNINDTDVWLWQMSADNTTHQTLWTKVAATTGNNVIYNSLNQDTRNIYSVLTRETDQIDLSFADGSFGNLPNGPFRLYYRQSNGLSYTIKPEQLNNVSVQIPYFSQNGQSNVLTLVLSLQYTVTNSAGSESDTDIKLKAPQAYYTQNRMITAEDYNIAPLTVDSDILKVKSVNRVSSGISKYYELSDVSGKYSTTDIFADDGALYREDNEYSFEFTFTTRNEIAAMVKQQLAPVVDSAGFYSFYLSKYPTITLDETSFPVYWNQSNVTTNQTRGYFVSGDTPVAIGSFVTDSLSFFTAGSLIKMVPPAGKFFLPNGKLTSVEDKTTQKYLWTQIVNVVGDGTNSGLGNLSDGTGPVIVTGTIPGDGVPAYSARPATVIPKFKTNLSFELETEIVNLCLSKRNFGLSFDSTTRDWYVIADADLNLSSDFSLIFQKDTTSNNKDASWMIAFEWTGKKYVVRYRVTDYIFESDKKTAFYVDTSIKNYDFINDTVIKDKIEVLSINNSPVEQTIANSALVTTGEMKGWSVNVTGATTSTFTLTNAFSVQTSDSGLTGVSGDIAVNNVAVSVNTVTSLSTFTAVTVANTVTILAKQVNLFTSTVVSTVTSITSTINLSTVTSVPVDGSILIRQTADLTTVTANSAVLFLDSTGITTGSHIAVYPNIYGTYSTVTDVTVSSVTISSTLTSDIITGTSIVFVPKSVNTVVNLSTVTTLTKTVNLFTSTVVSTVTSLTTSVVLTTSTTLTSSINYVTTETYNFTTTVSDYGIYLDKKYIWQIDSAIIQEDGYVEPKKVLVSFYDYNDDGQVDDPDAFENIVASQTTSTQSGYLDKFVYFQKSTDGISASIYSGEVTAYPNEDAVLTEQRIDGNLYYFYDQGWDVVKRYSGVDGIFVLEPSYYARVGRKGLKFHYVHNSSDERRIDPSKTNIIDVYLLTKEYDLDYRNWLSSGIGSKPLPPTTQSLEENYAATLEPIKGISDEIIYHPVQYKVLFGQQAEAPLQATFKAVLNPARTVSVTDLQTRILSAIEEFFAIENWNFGQTFNFSELSTYVMNIMTPDIINFVIVPKLDTGFGSLYQITCASNEIFVNGAKIEDIQIIDGITATELKAASTIVTSS